MADPRPLTQTPPAKLDWSRPATPSATAFGDIYFSTDGGLEETRTVFLQGCGLPERWENSDCFTIAELGFGSGLNFLAAWQLWAQTAKPRQRLQFLSIEKFPFDRTQLRRALAAWPELAPLSEQLIRAWPGRVKGIHRLNFGPVTLTLVHEDVETALAQLDNLKANAWFLDGFNPSSNPAMWSEPVMDRVAQASAPGARLATFSVAGAVRAALQKAEFDVRKMPGFGRKRHRLEADFSSRTQIVRQRIERALIVGAGIAGYSLARALQSRHIDFDIIDNDAHPAASHNPLVLVKPRFDLQDRPESRFFLSSYLHALRTYPDEAILERGVCQMPKTDKEAARFEKLAQQSALGEDHLKWQDEALWIESAAVIDPVKIFAGLEVRREAYTPSQTGAAYSHVFLAAGYGIRQLAPQLDLRCARGQLSWVKPIWDTPTAYGGYAVNLNGETLIGATYDRLDDRDPFELRNEDDVRNYTALAEISGRTVEPLQRRSRASIRVTTADTLPVMAQINDKSWALTGLGSRGFTFAPLLAEAMIANICGEVGPLEKTLKAKLSASS